MFEFHLTQQEHILQKELVYKQRLQIPEVGVLLCVLVQDPQSVLSLTSSWPLFVSQHADVLAKTLTQCDGHGPHAAKLKTHTCIKYTTFAINNRIYSQSF